MKDDCKKEMPKNISNMEEIRKIGQRISYYRRQRNRQRNITQKELAIKANISISYISKIESAGTDVTFSLLSLYQIAKALGLEPYHLLMPVNEKFLSDSKN